VFQITTTDQFMNFKTFCPARLTQLFHRTVVQFQKNWSAIAITSIAIFIQGCKFFEPLEVSTVAAVPHPTNYEILSSRNNPSRAILQASGWIEPDPFPIRVTSLYDGVVKEVFVLEGELISAGQKLASLVDEDVRLAVKLAEKEVLAQKSKEDEMESLLSLQRLSLAKAKKENLKVQSLFHEQQDYTARLESLPKGSIRSFDLNQSRYKRDTAKFASEAALYNEKIAKEQIELLSRKLISQKQQTKIAEIHLEKANLDLNRTVIFSPVSARILKLFAQPGKRLMRSMDAPDASTVVSLYQEDKLQARIDVPLADASKLVVGQEVEITCSMLPDSKFKGKLSRIVGEADLQRNTLQVKVKILNPDTNLRPEMLCRAKFFQMKNNDENNTKTRSLGVFVPQSLQQDKETSQGNLWVIGKDGKTAEIREVEFGTEIINQYILVLKGLNAGDQIILNPPNDLQSGDLVKISAIK
jgi:HlyD family secretion protein